ncbi:FecR domain-containing protein [Pedobacter sp. PLR]|uniref:FecR family protein n=1 Tax=Pedobacter sp. PLR TaxID=2994465 RepID=UPI002245CBF3|nr:FecR domain-containing protein [Pedobacter sp. PLR]MCX2454226.1 FecR domain-containing protein [Pedobacter sp. PLR]
MQDNTPLLNRAEQILRYLRHELTVPEEGEFLHWLSENPGQQKFVAALCTEQGMEAELRFMDHNNREEDWHALQQRIQENSNRGKGIWLWQKVISIAAVLLVLTATGFYFYEHFGAKPKITIQDLAKHDIQAGGNKAYLTLADGKQIALTDLENGKVAEQAGLSITKMADGKLLYELKDDPEANHNNKGEISYNTISTPAGGQYQVVLPDGSRVWLNAASSLRYATSLASLKERKVELSGEAYFEVSKAEGQSGKPFIVKSRNQEVEVLGTHFNVCSYDQEPSSATTLLEGRVKVRRSGVFERTLTPGEQSLVGKGIEVRKVDTVTAVAWKNGLFKFEDANIYEVMNQFSRWYNFEVAYEGKVPDNKFKGEVYRNLNASKAMKLLSYANIKFRVEVNSKEPERKKIIITSNQ